MNLKFGFQSIKAQGSTEYLVIFAAILVVGLVVAGLLSDTIKISGDVKKMQDQIFWQSRSPIAILDGKAKIGIHNNDHTTEVYLVLKNTGKYPIELFAIAPEIALSPSILEVSPGVYTCNGHGNVAALSPECFYDGSYQAFIPPPRGNGWGTYTHKNIINPGEEIYIGYTFWNYQATFYDYFLEDCYNSNKLVLPYLKIFYKEKIGNLEIFKQQYENHKLILPCEE
jgi:hypothetical protein